MTNKINFDTSNKTFSEIIGNGKKYKVPKYQRDYSWKEEQWAELWEDIMVSYKQREDEREQHYMGYLVLQKEGINRFKIIDGQQRLTTLSLFILAVLQYLKKSELEEDQKRLKLLEDSYICTTDTSSLRKTFKLELNRNNNSYYKNDLANLSDNPQKRNLKNTEHLLRKAKEFFEKKITEEDFKGAELGELSEFIGNYLLFTEISVGDDVNAYKVFETLNARGIQLSVPDLLKNHLFSIIDPDFSEETLIDEQEEKWEIVLNNLGKQDFNKFLRTVWNSRYPLVTKTALFKKLKSSITTKQEALNILNDLKEFSWIYSALKNYNDELWKDINSVEEKKRIQECLYVLQIYGIVQPYGILLNAYSKYSGDEFSKVCKYLTSFCIRYHIICQLPPNDMERCYNSMAMGIYNGKPIEFLREQLLKYFPKDEYFRSAFATKTFSTTQSPKKVNYLLISLENQINPSSPQELVNRYTLEHILPQSTQGSDDYWRGQFGDLLEQHIPRLGNMTLLVANDNESIGNQDFQTKKETYEKSSLAIVKKLCDDYSEWNSDSLTNYQNWLAKKALQYWRID